MPEVLQDLQRGAIALRFGRDCEFAFFQKLSKYAMYIYELIMLKGIPNPKKEFIDFLYILGQNRKLLRDSQTFDDGKKAIMKAIVDLQKELE